MTVHDLFTTLSQCDRSANVTVVEGKLYVDGKRLQVEGEVEKKEGEEDK